MEIEKEIQSTKEITGKSDREIENLKIEINHKNNLVEEANKKLKPLRDKNIEILSKLQRLNLESKNLEEEEERTKTDKDRLLKSQITVEEDTEREKNIIFEAQSNGKRLNEEKNILIDTEKKYYDLIKRSENDLHVATEELNKEQNILEEITKNLTLNMREKEFIKCLDDINLKLESAKIQIGNNENLIAKDTINNIIESIKKETIKLKSNN